APPRPAYGSPTATTPCTRLAARVAAAISFLEPAAVSGRFDEKTSRAESPAGAGNRSLRRVRAAWESVPGMVNSFTSLPPNAPLETTIAAITATQIANVRFGCSAQARTIRASLPCVRASCASLPALCGGPRVGPARVSGHHPPPRFTQGEPLCELQVPELAAPARPPRRGC